MSGGQETELSESQKMWHQILDALSVRVDMQELRGIGAEKTFFEGMGVPFSILYHILR